MTEHRALLNSKQTRRLIKSFGYCYRFYASPKGFYKAVVIVVNS